MVGVNPQADISPRARAVQRDRSALGGLIGILVVALLLSGCTAAETTSSTTLAATTTGPGAVRDLADCSAHDLVVDTSPQAGVPPDVERTRRALVDAALACDFDRLSELANAGSEPFLFGRNQEGDAASYWRREELAGEQPLRFLVRILQLPMATVTRTTTEYRWPSAAGYTSWANVPDAIRDTLEELYDEDDFARFETINLYVGYRTSISSDGEWLSLRGQD